MTFSWLAHDFLMPLSCLSHDFFLNFFLWNSCDFLMSSSWLYHDFIMTLSWLSRDFLMIFSWRSHEFLMTFSWLCHDFVMTFSWISLDFLMTFSLVSHDFLMTFSWLSHEIITTFTWLSYEFHMNCLWISHDFLMTFSWLSYDFLLTFSWLSHDFLMNFSQLSDDFSWTFELAMVCAVSALVVEIGARNIRGRFGIQELDSKPGNRFRETGQILDSSRRFTYLGIFVTIPTNAKEFTSNVHKIWSTVSRTVEDVQNLNSNSNLKSLRRDKETRRQLYKGKVELIVSTCQPVKPICLHRFPSRSPQHVLCQCQTASPKPSEIWRRQYAWTIIGLK